MKKALLVWFLVIALVAAGCSSSSESTDTTQEGTETTEATAPAETPMQTQSTEENAADQAAQELDAAQAAEEQARLDAEKAAAEKAEAEKLLAEAGTAEEKAAAEKLLAEKEAEAKAIADALAKAEAQKAAAEKIAAEKFAAERLAAQKAAQKAAATQNNKGTTASATKTDVKPVTLKVIDNLFTDKEFNELIAPYVKAKYDHITLERKVSTNVVLDIQNMIAAGEKVDIIFSAIFNYQGLNQLGVIEDMTDLIKKRNIDISTLEKGIYDYLKAFKKGEIVGLPLYRNIQALFYNKDIFDRLGVEYPKDGLTYDEAVALGKRLTRNVGGTQIYGFHPLHPANQLRQLSTNFLNATTDESLLVSDPSYPRVLKLHQEIFSTPGMIYMSQNQARTAFHTDKSLAMYIDFMGNFVRTIPTSKVNWDMALAPVFPDRPNAHTQIDFHAAFVSSLSSNKEAAADVVGFMSTTRYLQAEFSDRGRIPVLNNVKILKQFGSKVLDGNNKPLMLNKNIDVLEKAGTAPTPAVSNYENQFALVGANFMSLAYTPYVTGKKDLTTALREAHEKINSSINAAKK